MHVLQFRDNRWTRHPWLLQHEHHLIVHVVGLGHMHWLLVVYQLDVETVVLVIGQRLIRIVWGESVRAVQPVLQLVMDDLVFFEIGRIIFLH